MLSKFDNIIISFGENCYLLSAKNPVYSNSVADPGSGAFLIPKGFGSGICYSRISGPRSNPQSSESKEKNVGLKLTYLNAL
jgi:hypothetical protein